MASVTRAEPSAGRGSVATVGATTAGLTIERLVAVDPPREFRLHPRDRAVVCTQELAGARQIVILSLRGGAPVQVTASEKDVSDPQWSPDGRRIVYTRGDEIRVVDADGSRDVLVASHPAGVSMPRWSPDGRQIAYLKGGQLWTMRADGGAARRLTTRAAAGPSWSPDGKWIAFGSLSCTGGPGVYRIATTAGAKPEVLFPRDCRSEDLPDEPELPTGRAPVALTERLRTDDAVAWSPDGTKIAFRGGDCDSVYDACLSVGTVATGEEQTVAAYGGGSLQTRGFAVVPGWRSDGKRLAWTAYQEGETAADNQPVHVVEYDPATRAKRTIGGAGDRELAYTDSTHALVTGQFKGHSWVLTVGLTDGSRTAFREGSQPSVFGAKR
jgi:TolB protein